MSRQPPSSTGSSAFATGSLPGGRFGLTLHRRFFSYCREMAALLRAQPPGFADPEARARERRRRVILSAIASAMAKVLSVATVLISVPLTLHYLGSERYGMWMTISSLIAMLSFADLGMGNGLLNSIAHAHGQGDLRAIRRFVSSGFTILTIVACSVLIAFVLAYPWLTWSRIFNARSVLAQSEAGPALATFVVLFALNIPLGVVGRVQTALQQSFSASLWQCAGSVLALICMLAVIYLQAGLPWLVAAAFGAQSIAAALNTAHFFVRSRSDLRPRYQDVSRVAIKHIATTGSLFLILQVVAAVAYASDNLVIAQLLGASAVTEYAVPEKLFSLIAMALAIMLAPLWPAYGEALARGDVQWVRSAFGRSLSIALGVASALSLLLVVCAPKLLSLWLGHTVNPPMLLLVGLGLWKIIEAGGTAVAVLLNGANVVRVQIVVGILTGICALTLKIVLIGHIGIAGTVWASIIAFSLISVIPLGIWAVPRALKIGSRHNSASKNHG
jgi:O-antigen/teichoic acid export membrane protein